MFRSSLLALAILVGPVSCFAQGSSSDSQTLRALLAEVHALRQDLQTTTIAAQRVQILIYRLQGQEAAVARDSQRLDEAKDQLARTQDGITPATNEIKQIEDALNNDETPAATRKNLETQKERLKRGIDSFQAEQQRQQTREIDAEQQLQADQAKLGEFHDQLERLDKSLENASHLLVSTSQ